ncbi:DUF6498-containing protein [Halobaculum sp. MBLA0147]|uniref:DUF6498-containing protein n=1 Tax=Halobaculum sp. MBLA0147 TaxID=3079934 RepID=UPI0035243BB9
MIASDWRVRVLRSILANAGVLVGVVAFDWPAAALLVVFLIEAAVATLRGAVQGLFARRDPIETALDDRLPAASWSAKSGGVSIGPLPPIYPRNVPVVLGGLLAVVLFWPIAGLVVVATADTGLPLASLAVGIVGVLLGQLVAAVDYVRAARYTDDTVRSAMGRRYVAGVVVLALGGGIVLAEYGAVPAALLAGVVLAKSIVDLGEIGTETTTRDVWEDDDPEPPAADPVAVFAVDRRSLLVRAPGLAPLFLFVPPYLLLVFVVAVVGLLGGLWAGTAALTLAVGLVGVGRVVAVDVLRGHREYHVYPNRVVVYDRLLETPQCSVRRKTITDVHTENSLLDRVRPGSRTVVVSTVGTDHRLHALRRPAAFVDTVAPGGRADDREDARARDWYGE